MTQYIEKCTIKIDVQKMNLLSHSEFLNISHGLQSWTVLRQLFEGNPDKFI